MFWDLFAYLGTCQVSTTVCRLDFISKPFLVPILGCPLRSVRRTGISSLVTHHWSGHYDVIHVLLFGCGFFLDNCLRQHVEIQRPEDPTHFGEQSLQDISVSFCHVHSWNHGIKICKFHAHRNFCLFHCACFVPLHRVGTLRQGCWARRHLALQALTMDAEAGSSKVLDKPAMTLPANSGCASVQIDFGVTHQMATSSDAPCPKGSNAILCASTSASSWSFHQTSRDGAALSQPSSTRAPLATCMAQVERSRLAFPHACRVVRRGRGLQRTTAANAQRTVMRP